MKRLYSTPTLGATVNPPQEENQKNNFAYSTEFQAMLDGFDDEDFTEDSSCQNREKKRRLSYDQVKALEKIFEVDSKVESEQKVKIAQELGLQPRQVAIWFQNRRARWKTKQLERHYGVLNSEYQAFKLKFDKLEKEKQGLVAEVQELRAKLEKENARSNHSVQEATQLSESENNFSEHSKDSLSRICTQPEEIKPDSELEKNSDLLEIRDGFGERNSSGFFNEQSDLNFRQLIPPPATPSSFRYECFSSSMYSSWIDYFQLLESRAKGYQDQFVKVEEKQSALFLHRTPSNIFSADEEK